MTEEEAREWLTAKLGVSRETLARLEVFAGFLVDENRRQNLVSRGTLEQIWARHVVDSAQLLRFAPSATATWLDLGSGAGFPGLIVALLHDGPVTLIEERRKRVEFLTQAAELLGVERQVTIVSTRVESAESRPYDVISARAFAPLDRLLNLSHSFSTAKTRFILPKGRNARSELEAVQASWQGEFRLEPSLTDDAAEIIIAERVSRVPKGRAARGRGAG